MVTSSDGPRSARFPWRTALTAVAVWLLLVIALEWRNVRLIPSWHGFLHSAIVERFMSNPFVTENPFFAGEPLPYYWVYHWLGAGLARLIHIGPLAALQLMALASLAVLVIVAMDLGRRLGGSTAAGALIGFLALAGANPFGPAVAGMRLLLNQEPLMNRVTLPVETQFVSDRQADDLMSHPLLGALYVGHDWRHGQNIVWFWDISARAPALVALMFLLWTLLCGRHRLLITLAAGTVTALNPLIGLTATGTLAGAWVLTHLFLPASTSQPGRRRVGADCLAMAAGVLMSGPTFIHLLQYGGAGGISSVAGLPLKATSSLVNYGALCVLASWGAWRAPEAHRAGMYAVTSAGIGLLGLAVGFGLLQGNEHNVANAAAILLAVPAGLAVSYGPAGSFRSESRAARMALIIGLIHVPMTLAVLFAFDGRPALPFRYADQLERTPADHPLAVFYAWVRSETPVDAILVTDPYRPIKMSGNASEVPAFTGRAQFVDQENYLTRPHAGFAYRTRLARALVTGAEITDDDRRFLRALARPIYLVTTEVADRAALKQRDGDPVFSADFVAVFRFVP